MHALSPIFLFLLIPWTAFALWALVGRRKKTWIPFLPLWDVPQELRKPKKGFEPPPVYLALALLASLLAILAVARPVLSNQFDRGRITLVIDRGDSMSAIVEGTPRFVTLARSAAPSLLYQFGSGTVRILDVVANSQELGTRDNWLAKVEELKPTSQNTAQILQAAIDDLARRAEPAVVLSDRDLQLPAGVAQLRPSGPVHNAAITAMSARNGQVMVTVEANTRASRTLSLQSGDKKISQPIQLEAATAKTLFIDLPDETQTLTAQLEPSDAYPADDSATLTRRPNAPGIEARFAVSDELSRMIAVYSRLRPADPSSPKIAVARLGDGPADQPAIFVPQATRPVTAAAIAHSAHPLLSGVAFPQTLPDLTLAPPPGEGWTAIATLEGKPILAVRETPARQIWVGFDSQAFARTPAYVIFWSNLFDWAGASSPGYTSTWLSPAVRFTSHDNSDWPVQLSRLTPKEPAGLQVSHHLALFTVALLLLSLLTWETRNSRERNAQSDSPKQGSSLTVKTSGFTLHPRKNR